MTGVGIIVVPPLLDPVPVPVEVFVGTTTYPSFTITVPPAVTLNTGAPKADELLLIAFYIEV